MSSHIADMISNMRPDRNFGCGSDSCRRRCSWIGEFYAYYQWFYGIPSVKVVERVPVEFLKKAYFGLHDLELELAVNKGGGIQ